MIGSTGILAAFICVFVSRSAAIKCLSCTEAARPRDCEYVQECGPHEKCSIEAYIMTSGSITYNVGCMDIMKCTAVGRKRAVLNITILKEIQQKDGFAIIPEELWDQNQRDMLACAECCDTELCNVKGCGELGLPPDSGPVCYGCQSERYPDQCNKIILCGRDYACYLSTNRIGEDLVYNSGCKHTNECSQLGILNIGAFDLVGRRRGFDMTSKAERSVLCNKCCTRNLCNADTCSSLTHLSITSTTQAFTTGGCLYKGIVYRVGHKWQDGCDYTCTCVNGTIGLYECNGLCLNWNITSMCYMEPPTPGKCCPQPRCPDYVRIEYPIGYQEL